MMDYIDYVVMAIQKLKPTAEFSITDGEYSKINWIVLDGDAPTESEINSTIEEIKADAIASQAQSASDKAALLAKLGITADEAKLLLG